MAQILVRDLDDGVVAQLKKSAKQNGRSLQAEVRTILDEFANAPKLDRDAALKSLLRLRKTLTGRKVPDSVKLVRQARDR